MIDNLLQLGCIDSEDLLELLNVGQKVLGNILDGTYPGSARKKTIETEMNPPLRAGGTLGPIPTMMPELRYTVECEGCLVGGGGVDRCRFSRN